MFFTTRNKGSRVNYNKDLRKIKEKESKQKFLNFKLQFLFSKRIYIGRSWRRAREWPSYRFSIVNFYDPLISHFLKYGVLPHGFYFILFCDSSRLCKSVENFSWKRIQNGFIFTLIWIVDLIPEIMLCKWVLLWNGLFVLYLKRLWFCIIDS